MPNGELPQREHQDVHVRGVDDVDVPIYRIFPLWLLEESIRLQRLTLVLPRCWEDPFEILGDAVQVTYHEDGQTRHSVINQDLTPAYAQCWSMTADSDTFWRAYSGVDKDPHSRRNTTPHREGVRVKTTVRKLATTLNRYLKTPHQGHVFLAAVRYQGETCIQQTVANTISRDGLDAYKNPRNRADLLTLKRRAFRHEAEVRVLFISEDDRRDAHLHIPFVPTEVFEEITFDPRLASFERNERKAWLTGIGYGQLAKPDDLYQGALLNVVMPESWRSR